MRQFVTTLVAQLQSFSAAEAIAVVFAVAYLLLAIRQSIWCWLCAGVSTAIFAALFFSVQLYMEALLNVFYFGMAVYGWRSWSPGRDDVCLAVVRWPGVLHLQAVVAICLCSAASGYLLQTRTDAAFPYIDSLTTWGAVWATFLVARKVLENWWYWLLIDGAMVCVFWMKGLAFTATLYVLYLLLIPIGLMSWARSYRGAQA